jgi:hypothetical protein
MSNLKLEQTGCRKVMTWIAGIIATIISGVIVIWLTTGIPSPLNSEADSDPGLDPGPESTIAPTPTTEEPAPQVWKEDTLSIPVANGGNDQVADLDTGTLLQTGTSIPVDDADLMIRQAVHGIFFEPGVSQGDGVTYDARFIDVNDAAVGQEGCADAAVSSEISNHLQLSSDVDVGSYICMVTTQGRLAEFTVTSVDLSSSPLQVEIAFVVWARE